MDAVLGTARRRAGTVETAFEPPDSTVSHLPPQRVRDRLGWPTVDVKTVGGESVDQVHDGRTPMVGQVVGQYVAQFDSAQPPHRVHSQTFTCRYDINTIVASRRA